MHWIRIGLLPRRSAADRAGMDHGDAGGVSGPPAIRPDAGCHRASVVVGSHLRRIRAAQTFTTANEIHIPVGGVLVRLHGADVIHSFWVPKLTGKTDTIPGRPT